MNRLAWTTDLHLNFVTESDIHAFCADIRKEGVDALVISGDTSDGPRLDGHLWLLAQALPIPIYFVLGNHDFYHASMADVWERVRTLCSGQSSLHWLPDTGLVPLSDSVGLLGHDGWPDGRFGDYAKSSVYLNDFFYIAEFSRLYKDERLEVMQALAGSAAEWIRKHLAGAFDSFDNILLVTHVPPFAEVACHKGQICTPDFLPYFACKAVGDVLLEIMQSYPNKQLVVLCGHTHSKGFYQPIENLRVFTGGARYHHPKVQAVLSLEDLAYPQRMNLTLA